LTDAVGQVTIIVAPVSMVPVIVWLGRFVGVTTGLTDTACFIEREFIVAFKLPPPVAMPTQIAIFVALVIPAAAPFFNCASV
jgi:hypothetical protein